MMNSNSVPTYSVDIPEEPEGPVIDSSGDVWHRDNLNCDWVFGHDRERWVDLLSKYGPVEDYCDPQDSQTIFIVQFTSSASYTPRVVELMDELGRLTDYKLLGKREHS